MAGDLKLPPCSLSHLHFPQSGSTGVAVPVSPTLTRVSPVTSGALASGLAPPSTVNALPPPAPSVVCRLSQRPSPGQLWALPAHHGRPGASSQQDRGKQRRHTRMPDLLNSFWGLAWAPPALPASPGQACLHLLGPGRPTLSASPSARHLQTPGRWKRGSHKCCAHDPISSFHRLDRTNVRVMPLR